MSPSCGICVMVPSHLRPHTGLWGSWHCDQASSTLTLGLCLGLVAGRADLRGPECLDTNPLSRVGVLSSACLLSVRASVFCRNCTVHLTEECLSALSSSPHASRDWA